MEIGYGGDIEALPEETGRNRRIKLPPVATAPSLYSEDKKKGGRLGGSKKFQTGKVTTLC